MNILKEYLMSVFKSACLKDLSKEKTKKVVFMVPCFAIYQYFLKLSLFWRGLCEM